MKPARECTIALLVTLGLFTAPGAMSGEVVEEIVAWVNGDIITRSDYEEEKQIMMAELYRRYSGEELDQELERARTQLLQQMIDRKILVHQARAIGYDLEKMGEVFVDTFKEQENISSDEEFERLLADQGMTRSQVESKLIEMYAPEEVIRYEVGQRVSVGDREIEAFYQENTGTFRVEGEVTLREIVLLADTAETKDERRDQAFEIRRRAVAEDFAELAKELSEAGTRDDGGLLGPLTKKDLSEVLAAAAFELPLNTVSEVMETPYGFHIVRVESRVESHTKPLDEIRDELRMFLESRKYREELETFLKKAREESEWCVKPKHQELLAVPGPTSCEKT